MLSLWLGMMGCSSISTQDPETRPDGDTIAHPPSTDPVPQEKGQVRIKPLPDTAAQRLRSQAGADSVLLLIWLDINDLEYSRAELRDSLSAWLDLAQRHDQTYRIFFCQDREPLLADQAAGTEAIFQALSREFPDIPLASRVVEQTTTAWEPVVRLEDWKSLDVRFVFSADLYNISREEFIFPIHEVLYKESRPMQWRVYTEKTIIPDTLMMERLGQPISFFPLNPISAL